MPRYWARLSRATGKITVLSVIPRGGKDVKRREASYLKWVKGLSNTQIFAGPIEAPDLEEARATLTAMIRMLQ